MELHNETGMGLTVGQLQTMVGLAILNSDTYLMACTEAVIGMADAASPFKVTFRTNDARIATVTVERKAFEEALEAEQRKKLDEYCAELQGIVDDAREALLTAKGELGGYPSFLSPLTDFMYQGLEVAIDKCDVMDSEIESFQLEQHDKEG